MDSVTTGKIYGINGPVIYLKGKTEFKMSEMVYTRRRQGFARASMLSPLARRYP